MKANRKTGAAGRRERRAFTTEFKAEAVRLVVERRALGVTLTQVGRELDVRPDQLRAWARLARNESSAGAALPGETLEQENRRLRREVAVLRVRAWKRPAPRWLAATPRAVLVLGPPAPGRHPPGGSRIVRPSLRLQRLLARGARPRL